MFFILLISICPIFAEEHSPQKAPIFQEILKQAKESYGQGLSAVSYDEQIRAFNRSLSLFHQLEEDHPNISLLPQMIGDNLFQLGEYPLAILYYYKALKQNPPNPELLKHLEMAGQKLGIAQAPAPSHANALIPFYRSLVLGLLLTSLFFLSALIWTSHNRIKQAAICSCLLFLPALISLIALTYSIPLEGILVHSTHLYSAPNNTRLLIAEDLLKAGSKVIVLQITSDNEWIKIIASNGKTGFIPTSYLRTIG